MSEPKQISPLLDGFTLGNPMSDHDGVRCCPAIKENSETKYIVKIISIPPSQVQMDALLLSGAYKDAAGAMDYYKTVADDVVKEAELLTKLSKLEGFLSYEGWQIEPITRRRLGYEVYLTGEYRRSLDKFVRRNPMTQLEAINLGLDMCAALSVCRQAGALYVDLKPTNIFVSDKKEYRIGDLGFVSLDALNYTTLPSKYRSAYTPPELEDPMASVGMTTDTYALGMILYQIYNDGQLPPTHEGEDIPSPVHADYELAEIILKTISAAPENRWQDPKEMGQALVAYMQRNAVNDVPITPYIPLEGQPEEEKPEAPVEEAPPAEEAASEEEAQPSEEAPPQEAEEPAPPEDESAPSEEDAESVMPHEMSDEMSRIMAKADDLIAHETPEGVVIPEIPEPQDPFAFAKEDEVDDTDVPLDPVMEVEEPEKKKKKTKTFASQDGKIRRKKFFSQALTLGIAAVVALSAFWCYRNLYIQTVDSIAITGDRSQMTVQIQSRIPDEKLTAVCTDQYGNVKTASVTNGKTGFSDLQPNTMYTVTLNVAGFHKLGGQTSQVFTTDTTTSILSFTSVAGSDDGSLILSFTVDGQEPSEWTVSYGYEGGETQYKTFTGHSFTVEGLKIGRVYTFQLDAGPDLSLGGKSSLEVMASRLILAENITASSAAGNDLTIRWRAPGDIVVDSWTVMCYSESGFEQELTVQETSAYFPNIDLTVPYTIEITASGMTQASRTSISANPIIIGSLQVAESEGKLDVSWDYTGEEPDGGWLLLYSIDGSDVPGVVKSDAPVASISPLVPGATYRFTIRAADGSTVLSNVQEYETTEAASYNANNLSADKVQADLVKNPGEQTWLFEELGEEAITTEFAAGDSFAMVLRSSDAFYLPGSKVEVLTLIRDERGSVIPSLIGQDSVVWKSIWNRGDDKIGEIAFPGVPTLPGKYTATVLIDGMVIGEAPFEIVQ